SGKKRDDLQAAITAIKELKQELPLQFINFRD
ncbi:MAG TPA: YajQ family cyclic di-GMP-binding protein, partial [Alphaproteobacteria bacterium]|nr:YajQ family cyclic di-GMP-binding protein [Alphaproteobacteria bacterium]